MTALHLLAQTVVSRFSLCHRDVIFIARSILRSAKCAVHQWLAVLTTRVYEQVYRYTVSRDTRIQIVPTTGVSCGRNVATLSPTSDATTEGALGLTTDDVFMSLKDGFSIVLVSAVGPGSGYVQNLRQQEELMR